MANLSASQIAGYASQAGFRGNALTIAVAVALAESGGNTQAINQSDKTDYGLWQINIAAHPQYSPQRLLSDPLYNAQAAYQISSSGSNWNPWTTFTNGAYKNFLNVASSVGGSGGTPNPPVPVGRWQPAYLQQMVQWIANPGIKMYGRWNAPANALEGGVDLPSPGGTPVYALADGPIVGAGNFWHGGNACLYTGGAGCSPGYGVVTQRIMVPGFGMQDLYYQHIAIAPGITTCYAGNCGSQFLRKGQQIGTIRSNVGELEMGFNANWGGVWGTNHPGPWVTDPRPLIKALMDAGPPGTPPGANFGGFLGGLGAGGPVALLTYTTLTSMVHETLINTPGFYGIALALDEAEQFPGWVNLAQQEPDISILGQDTGFSPPDVVGTVRSIGATISDNFLPFVIRSGLVFLGMALLVALIAKAAQPQIEVAQQQSQQAVGAIAELAPLLLA
jgi:hypothetical protein